MDNSFFEETKVGETSCQNVAKIAEKLRIGYVYSPELLRQCDRVPNLLDRVSMFYGCSKIIYNVGCFFVGVYGTPTN